MNSIGERVGTIITKSKIDAARAAGAYGGTVIHAKGTGMELLKNLCICSWQRKRKLYIL